MSKATQIIREHHDEIIRLWLENAGRLLSAEGLAAGEIVSNLPSLLSALANVSDEDAPGQFAATARKLIEGHLSARLRQGFDIEDVVAELSLLGRCIVDAWGQAQPLAPPRGEEVQRIYSQLSSASVAATELFRAHMMLEEQQEKRVMRQMSAIAEHALHNERPLTDRLDDLITLIMRAMGAQSASIVVYDASAHGHIVASTAIGVGHDALARFALDPRAEPESTRPGLRGAPTVTRAEATEMHVGEELWEHGVRSLLALRATRHSLSTLMYVGTTRVHAFSSRETRRIEALGEWLTVLLDNAMSHARLAVRVAALSRETEVRDRLVALIAHDLRGPLSAAKMCAELLARKGRRARERGEETGALDDELAMKICRLLLRCDGMIGNLLDANRLHAGESLRLELAPCDLPAICRGVVEELHPALAERVRLALGPAFGNWSASELQRAVWNLVTNAFKYGDKDSIVTIATQETREGAELTVHNVGAPIDERDLANIFHPFARAVSPRARSQEGWGLGLALVKGCAEAHGGDVSVQSDAHGTTFTLRLPHDAEGAQAHSAPLQVHAPRALDGSRPQQSAQDTQ